MAKNVNKIQHILLDGYNVFCCCSLQPVLSVYCFFFRLPALIQRIMNPEWSIFPLIKTTSAPFEFPCVFIFVLWHRAPSSPPPPPSPSLNLYPSSSGLLLGLPPQSLSARPGASLATEIAPKKNTKTGGVAKHLKQSSKKKLKNTVSMAQH